MLPGVSSPVRSDTSTPVICDAPSGWIEPSAELMDTDELVAPVSGVGADALMIPAFTVPVALISTLAPLQKKLLKQPLAVAVTEVALSGVAASVWLIVTFT